MLQLSRFILLILFLVMLPSCQQPQQDVKSEVSHLFMARNTLAYLEREYALMRASQIQDVNYHITMNLDDNSTFYSGEVTINFTLAQDNISPLTIDFSDGKVSEVFLNGVAVNFAYNQYFIQLAPDVFTQEKNQLKIVFEHEYSQSGEGLHRYQDQQTGNVYLYSHFEPYHANKMFPHFDQPDIKAHIELTVYAPPKWQVISARRESSVSEQNGKKRWIFPATPKISSYMFSLHAGPYKVWEEQSGIPLRIFARQEFTQYVQPKEWFSFTRQSLDFYHQYFDMAFPFEKYDQLIVPDLNKDAMANISSVTFSEAVVGRGAKLNVERFHLANQISRQLSQMWLGGLVTMDWWNGLWLNESLATYLSYLQMSENSEFIHDSWDFFYRDITQPAFLSDQSILSRPIKLSLSNTAEAVIPFDNIRYAKGASVLKQLAYRVGDESFRKAIVNYLKKYKDSNVELTDFMNELDQFTDLDLKVWVNEWVDQAGVNIIQADFVCGDKDVSPLSRFAIHQSASQYHSILRTQKIGLVFYQVDNSANQQSVYPTAEVPLVYSGEKTLLPIENNMACPDFVYPNLHDMGYVKIVLDEKSLANLKQHLNRFDSAMRIRLWQYLWDEVLYQRMSLTEYIGLLDSVWISENAADVFSISTKMQMARDYFWLMRDDVNRFEKELLQLEKITWRELQSAQAGSDIQKIWFDTYVQMAYSSTALNRLADYLTGRQKVRGLVYDQDRRWATIVRLNNFQHRAALSLTEKEKRKDNSHAGREWALISDVIKPDAKTKKDYFEVIVAKNSQYNLPKLRLIMANLFPASQMMFRKSYSELIVFNIPILYQEQNQGFIYVYLSGMLPGICTAEGVQQLLVAAQQYGSLDPVIEQYLTNAVQEEQRCVAIKKRILEK